MGASVTTTQTAKVQRAEPQRSPSCSGRDAGACRETSSIARLQRSVGNRASARLLQPRTSLHSRSIQPKLTVSHPEDESEREADKVAEQVMRVPQPGAATPVQVEEHEEEEDEPQATRSIQRQIKDNDRKPLRSLHQLLQPCAVPQVSASSRVSLQRRCAECEEEHADEDNPSAIIHRKFSGDDEAEDLRLQPTGVETPTPDATPSTIHNIPELRQGGSPLPDTTRAFFEPRFGADFGRVRLHTDSRAGETVRSINARAFTVGSDIAFGDGEFAPHSHEGRRLLAHELTHVLQQGGARRARNERGLTLLSLTQNSSVQTSREGVIQRAPISEAEQASDEGSLTAEEPQQEDEEMEPEVESTDECETGSEEPREAATGRDLGEESTILAAGNSQESKPKRPGFWARLMEELRNRRGCKPFGKRKKKKKPKGQPNLARCFKKYKLDQTQIASGRQPQVTNRPTNRNFSLSDPNCVYVVRWDMKNIPDRIIITDNISNSVIVDTGMLAGIGSQVIRGPANINIRVIPNDGTGNPNNAPTVYEYTITATCGLVKEITTCYWLGIIPMGQKIESVTFNPNKDYSRKKSKRMSRDAAKRLLGKN